MNTVQTLWGYVQMYVYDTGRDMMELGVIPAANMLTEVAYVKLGWALGQTDDPEKVKQAFQLMKKAKPKIILLNLFGGITKCDTVAKVVSAVISSEGIDCPIITRIKGCNEGIAKDILKDAGLFTAESLQDAAKKSTELAGE